MNVDATEERQEEKQVLKTEGEKTAVILALGRNRRSETNLRAQRDAP